MVDRRASSTAPPTLTSGDPDVPSVRSGTTDRTGGRRGVRIAGLIGLLIAVAFILSPIVRASLAAFQDATEFGSFTGVWTLVHIRKVLTTSEYLVPLGNTMVLAVSVTVGSLLVGGVLAWSLGRVRNLPLRRSLEVLVVIPFFLSPFTTAIAWVILLAGRAGLINVTLREQLGLDLGLDIFSAWGVIFVMIVSFTPIAYLGIVNAVRGIDSQLEEAAAVAGSTRLTSLRTVVLPLLRPAILSSGMLVFILAAEIYTVPGYLGTPARYTSFPYAIIQDMTSFPIQRGPAAAGGLVLLVITLIGMLVYRRSTRQAHRYVTIGGKGTRQEGVELGAWRWAPFSFAAAYILLALVLPVAGLVAGSLQRFFGAPLQSGNYDTAVLFSVLSSPQVLDAVRNTAVVAVLAGVVATLVALLISYVSLRTRVPGRVALDVSASLPLAVPGVVIGLGFLWLYVRTPLYGTVMLLVLVNVIRWLPFGMGVTRTGLLQVGPELEESARVSGASNAVLLRDIIVPVLRTTLLSSFLFIAIMAVKELAASLLLVNPRNRVLAVETWNAAQAGTYNAAAALALVQVAMLLGLFLVARLGFKIDLAAQRR
ncbi:MAG: iron ABC transporter permease [Dehalococcoidia bacterium]